MYSYEINIVCDNWQGKCPNNRACQTSEPVATVKEAKIEILSIAIELGWLIKNGKHYCPDCARLEKGSNKNEN